MKTILVEFFVGLMLASLLIIPTQDENSASPTLSDNIANVGQSRVVQAPSPADFVRRQGSQLVVGADDRPIRLRGVNLSADRLAPAGGGDWFLGTCQELASHTSARPVTNWYQEKHFQSIAAIGFNTIRVDLNYRIFEDDANPGVYKGSGWNFLDHYVQWAKNNGLYLILDLHVPPGGLQPSGGGGACLWDDAGNQTRLVNLWRAIAQRYADEPAIAAYDLLNEPSPTPSHELTRGAEKWQALAQRIADAIRQVDQNHLIIVERVNWIVAADGTSPLSDWNLPLLASFQVSVNDSNTVYDFHFYEPFEYTLQNEGSMPDDGRYPDESQTQPAKDGTTWPRNKNYLNHELTLEMWDNGPMFVGEWGPNPSTFNEVKGGFTYIRDLFDLLDDHSLHWAYYSMFNLYQVSCCDTGVVCCSGDNLTTPNTGLINLFTELFSTPTVTPTATTTPTPASTPTPTSTPDANLTTIQIRNEVKVSQVKRFGINVGWRDRWGAGQILKNLIDNPGFEAGLYGSIIHADAGATGTRVPQAFWDTSWNNGTWGIGQPEGFWNGAQYEIVSGPAQGRTGTITNFTHENNQYVFYLDSDGVAPEQYDAIIVRQQLPGVDASGDGISADTATVRPGSPGSQSLHLVYPGAAWQTAYNFYMDSLWRDGDRSAGKLLIVQGNWHLEFWAKGKNVGDQLRVRFFREGEADFIDETIPLTTRWQKIQRDFYVPPGADPVRAYTRDEYHPILGFAFYFLDANAEAWVDDVALYRSDDTHPTVFTDRFVGRLKELKPGILRDWDNHQFGNTLDNELAVPPARKTTGYRPGERTAGGYGYSLHEFLELCREVGAEPWHVIPPTSSPADLANLAEYLAGPADGAHSYADRRAALGQVAPWTDVFPTIHLEFGNELWGSAMPGDPYFGASLRNGARLGQIAHDRLAILKTGPYYDPAKFDLIIGGQAGFPARQQEIENNSSNHDRIALAPYFQFTLDRYGSDEELFYPVFAQPFDNVTSGIVRQSKDFVDSVGQGTGLAIYELNFHTTGGNVPLDIRNDLVTGMAGIAPPLHMLVYLREFGVKNQVAYGAHGFAARLDSGDWVRLWGMLRDLEATGRKRPTWLGVELTNKAIWGDMLVTVQGGANPTWHQMPFNGVLNEIDVSFVQSFAFRDAGSYAVVLFNLSLDQPQPVRLDLPASPKSQAAHYELTSPSIHDDNEDAESVRIQTWQLTDFADAYPLTLPPHSVSVLVWHACYDLTGDHQVTIADIQAVAGRWQDAGQYDPRYDTLPDGVIDVLDVMQVITDLGHPCPP